MNKRLLLAAVVFAAAYANGSSQQTAADVLMEADRAFAAAVAEGGAEAEGPGPDGTTARAEGICVSIWRLQPDGTWKVVMDLGNPVTGSP